MPIKSRLVFIDLLRGWAVLVMVEVHVFNAFIIPEFRSESWFDVLSYINGLVAPSFIFISGFVFLLASQKKLDSFRKFGPDFWRQIWRIALVWIVGYYLHVPFFSYKRVVAETTEVGWLSFYQSDVLHCIAFGLFFLFILRLIIKSNLVYKYSLLASGIVVTCIAPFIWDIDFTKYIPAPVAAYMNSQNYSLFPLFPWMAFMLFAGYFAAGYIEAREDQKEREYIKRFSILGAVLVLTGAIIRISLQDVVIGTADVGPNPFFFIERLGIVMLLLSLCWLYAEKRKTKDSFVLNVSRQSLMAYAGHLMVIYGEFLNDTSLVHYYGKTFTPSECIIGTFSLLFLMVIASIIWDWLKRDHLSLARTVFAVFAITTTVWFFIR